MSHAFQPPLPTFTGLDGLPLSGGYVYFGSPSQDPLQNPVTVYWDEAQTLVATQPLRTNAGYIVRNGSPATVWVTDSCSVLAKDSANRQVFYVPDWITPALAVNAERLQALADIEQAKDDSVADVQEAQATAEAAVDVLVTEAEGLRDQTLLARDAATLNTGMKGSQAAGLATTASGQYFAVPNEDSNRYATLYLNNSGSAQEIAVYPSLAAVQEALGDVPETATSFLGDEPQGLSVVVTTNQLNKQVRVIDAATPANNYDGDLLSFLASSCFPSAKIVTRQDGALGWSDHNFLSDSEGFNTGNWIKTTMTAAAPSGGLCLLTATSTAASLRAPATIVEPGRWYTDTFIGKAGTAPFAYIRLQGVSDLYAYFNLSNGTVGTVDAGLTASIYTTYEDGSALPTGEYRMVVSRQLSAGAASFTIHYGLADANGSTAVTSGRTGSLRRAALCWGKKPTQYLRTTSGTKYGIPYDWSKGERRVLIEEWTTRFESKYGDDLTNSVWVKMNVTAALDATGPHGEPCSSLTATAANGTCLQSFTSTHPTNTFQARVKRRTGTGTVEMTINGGSTWTDITAQINTGSFSLVYVKGASTSVNMGFRLGTSGDAIEVALAVNGSKAGTAVLMAPVTTHGAAGFYQHTSDLFRIPFTKFNTGSQYSCYFDFEVSDDPAADAEAAGVVGGAEYHEVIRSRASASPGVNRGSKIGGSTYTAGLGDSAPRIECAIRVKANDIAATVNGGGEVYDNRPGLGAMTNIIVGCTTGQIFLRRILVVPRALADDELRLWRYSGEGADPRYLADVKLNKFKEVANTHISREPGLEVIKDTDDYALLFAMFFQRNINANPGSGEAPGRIVGNMFRFDKTTHELTNLTGQIVLAQQPGWATGLGHQQGVVAIKLRYGAKAGRVLMLYGQLDSASGILDEASGDYRRMYCMYSDDNCATWSSPVMVLDPGLGNYALPASPCRPVQITTGTYAGRVIVPYYRTAWFCGALYSDDNGATWTSGATGASTFGAEPTIHVLPDGQTLVMTMRQEASPWRTYATSTNGGASWSASTAMTLVEGQAVGMTLLQNDPDGEHGLYGEQLLMGARLGAPTYFRRSKLTIEEVKGATLAVSGTQFCPVGKYRATGYTAGARISGGYLGIAYESAPTGNLNDMCDLRLMVVRWP